MNKSREHSSFQIGRLMVARFVAAKESLAVIAP
jgi:hypothetical protein